MDSAALHRLATRAAAWWGFTVDELRAPGADLARRRARAAVLFRLREDTGLPWARLGAVLAVTADEAMTLDARHRERIVAEGCGLRGEAAVRAESERLDRVARAMRAEAGMGKPRNVVCTTADPAALVRAVLARPAEGAMHLAAGGWR